MFCSLGLRLRTALVLGFASLSLMQVGCINGGDKVLTNSTLFGNGIPNGDASSGQNAPEKPKPGAPKISNSAILTTAIAASDSTSVSLSWEAATDKDTPADKLSYSVCISAADPALNSFSTEEQVLSGTCTTQIGVTTATLNPTAGHTYLFNVVVKNKKGLKSVYTPKGEILDNALVDYYPFEGNINDVVTTDGYGQNNLSAASYTNDVPALSTASAGTSVTDRLGLKHNAYSFSGSSQCLMSANNVDSSVTGNNSHTITLWTNLATINNDGGSQVAASIGALQGYGSHFGLYVPGGGGVWQDWFWGEDVSSSSTAVASTWQFWAVTYSGQAQTMATLYLNGIAVGNADRFDTPPIDDDSPLFLGCGVDNGSGSEYNGQLQDWFAGSIDDVRIFNRTLCDGLGDNGCIGNTETNEVGNLYLATAPSNTVLTPSLGFAISGGYTFPYVFSYMESTNSPDEGDTTGPSESITVTVTNNGLISTTLGAISLSSLTPPVDTSQGPTVASPASLAISSDTCSQATLVVGASCTFDIGLTDLNASLANNPDMTPTYCDLGFGGSGPGDAAAVTLTVPFGNTSSQQTIKYYGANASFASYDSSTGCSVFNNED